MFKRVIVQIGYGLFLCKLYPNGSMRNYVTGHLVLGNITQVLDKFNWKPSIYKYYEELHEKRYKKH